MTTSNDSLRSIVEHFFRRIDAQAWDDARDLTTPSCKVTAGGQVMDREGWIGMGQMFMTAFPDGKHDLAKVLIAGDHATILGTFRGTHRGAFGPVAATGKTIALPFTTVYRISEGRIAEAWLQFDSGGLMAQLSA